MLHKDTLRLIKKTFNRFFSLLMIVLIGAGFMMGLLSTRTIMEESVDAYDDEYALQDIQVYSTYGFDEQDASALKNQEFVKDFFATKMVDAMSETQDGTLAVTRIEEIDRDVNEFLILEGELPKKENELLILDSGLSKEHYVIGEKLKIFLEDGDIKDSLKNDEYIITGFAKSPAYMSKTLGTSNLKNLDLSIVGYVPNSNFVSEYYTSMYFTAKGLRGLNSFSKEYKDAAEDVMGETEFFAREQQDHLKDKILAEYKKEISEGEAELEEKRKAGEEELEDARRQLEEARIKIIAGESQIESLEMVLAEAQARQDALVSRYSADALTAVRRIEEIENSDADGREFDEIYAELVTDYGTYTALTNLAESIDSSDIEGSIKRAEDTVSEIGNQIRELEERLSRRTQELLNLENPGRDNEATGETGTGLNGEAIEEAIGDALNGLIEERDIEPPEIDINGIAEDVEQAVRETLKGLSENSEIPEGLGDRITSGISAAVKQVEKELEGRQILPDDVAAEVRSRVESAVNDALANAEDNIELPDNLKEELNREVLAAALEAANNRGREAEERARTEMEAARKQAEERAEAARKTAEEQIEAARKEAEEKANQAGESNSDSTPVNQETIDNLKKEIAELQKEIEEQTAELQVYERLVESYRDLKEQALGQMNGPSNQAQELQKKYGGDIEGTFNEYTKYQQDRLVNEALQREMQAVNSAIAEAQAGIDQSKREVETGKKSVEEGEIELRRNEIQFGLEIEKAEAEIKKAYQDLDALPEAQWIVLDRDNHYSSYMYANNAKQMGAIGISLPVLFYLVAALVCMTTMTRLVDEQRGQIGILRALGFSRRQIVGKYVTYALLATLIGGGIGVVVGMGIFPTVIYRTWRLMYDLPDMANLFPLKYLAICFVSFALVMAAVTIGVVLKALREAPSQLMRPKAPKSAKKVFLEKIHGIWWRLSFTTKITARNLIRYKSRFIMTVIGVAGCTGLLILGWGIKDSISDIVAIQYGEYFNYNYSINLEEDADAERMAEVLSEDLENEYVAPVLTYVSKVYVGGDEPTVTVVTGDARRLNEIFLLREKGTDDELKIKNSGVIISEKFAKNNDIKKGDTITIESNYGVKADVKVDDICKMYFQHYLFISGEAYESIFDETPKENSILVKNPEGDGFISEVENMDGYISTVDFTAIIDQFNTMISALDFIILVIIITAGALAFVVLINLTQVNISERVREIATLKVLGFRTGEVNSYIFKEVLMLSAIGGLIGIPLGIIEHHFIMNVINMEMIMFGQNIKLMSFIYAFGLTMLFTLIVLLLTRRSLKKIAMVESLKSVE